MKILFTIEGKGHESTLQFSFELNLTSSHISVDVLSHWPSQIREKARCVSQRAFFVANSGAWPLTEIKDIRFYLM
ncbi:MAG: hypothetical protein G3M78_10580 [Candidatus Nitrohelix vancouverensis]|uniref:Uncharacterized protein n=1 Tax=Candidatus Nitrohelix vancouverensis TaxID=2705534 RepID=A0A7T0C3D8_9BACT|nr:MAG: hypothetical protein G3M78_10580 [Candidatus Nitrohelix vancouverensis]